MLDDIKQSQTKIIEDVAEREKQNNKIDKLTERVFNTSMNQHM